MRLTAVIQINDTHPTMVIPELIRILTEEEGFSMDEAVELVSKTCAYTNHTILAEALETWPLEYLEKAVPAIVPDIRELEKLLKYVDDDTVLNRIMEIKQHKIGRASCRERV